MAFPIYLALETTKGEIKDKEQKVKGFEEQLFVQDFIIGASIKGASVTNAVASSSSIPQGDPVKIFVGMGSHVPQIFDSCFNNAQVKTATFSFIRTNVEQKTETVLVIKATEGTITKADLTSPPYWELQGNINQPKPQLLEVHICYKELSIEAPLHSTMMEHEYAGITG